MLDKMKWQPGFSVAMLTGMLLKRMGGGYILNKPDLATVATSGSYNDLQDKPTAMTGATAETAGQQGFVPAPEAGDEEKVLTGSGQWKHASGLIDITELANDLNGKADKTEVANLAMPSDNAFKITVSSSNNSYTAIEDGYVSGVGLGSSTQYSHLNIYNEHGLGSMVSISPNSAGKVLLPVRRGQKFTVDYVNLARQPDFYFVYANGSQP